MVAGDPLLNGGSVTLACSTEGLSRGHQCFHDRRRAAVPSPQVGPMPYHQAAWVGGFLASSLAAGLGRPGATRPLAAAVPFARYEPDLVVGEPLRRPGHDRRPVTRPAGRGLHSPTGGENVVELSHLLKSMSRRRLSASRPFPIALRSQFASLCGRSRGSRGGHVGWFELALRVR